VLRARLTLGFSAFAVVLGLSTGCGGDGGGAGGSGGGGGGDPSALLTEYCTSKAACDGGNDKDIKACAASFSGARNEAAAYGCEASYDILTQCLWTKSSCKDMLYGADCSTEQYDVNKCEADAAAGK
jgi:hypothetical protein